MAEIPVIPTNILGYNKFVFPGYVKYVGSDLIVIIKDDRYIRAESVNAQLVDARATQEQIDSRVYDFTLLPPSPEYSNAEEYIERFWLPNLPNQTSAYIGKDKRWYSFPISRIESLVAGVTYSMYSFMVPSSFLGRVIWSDIDLQILSENKDIIEVALNTAGTIVAANPPNPPIFSAWFDSNVEFVQPNVATGLITLTGGLNAYNFVVSDEENRAVGPERTTEIFKGLLYHISVKSRTGGAAVTATLNWAQETVI